MERCHHVRNRFAPCFPSRRGYAAAENLSSSFPGSTREPVLSSSPRTCASSKSRVWRRRSCRCATLPWPYPRWPLTKRSSTLPRQPARLSGRWPEGSIRSGRRRRDHQQARRRLRGLAQGRYAGGSQGQGARRAPGFHRSRRANRSFHHCLPRVEKQRRRQRQPAQRHVGRVLGPGITFLSIFDLVA